MFGSGNHTGPKKEKKLFAFLGNHSLKNVSLGANQHTRAYNFRHERYTGTIHLICPCLRG